METLKDIFAVVFFFYFFGWFMWHAGSRKTWN